MTVITVSTREPLAVSATPDFEIVAKFVSNAGAISNEMPFAIPRDQLYYWTTQWQAGIRESLDALAAGEYVEFNSSDPNDIVRWMLEPDDN